MKVRRECVASLVWLTLCPAAALGWHEPDAQPGDVVALARKAGCFKCHSAEKAVVGPSFHDISARYTEEIGQYDLKVISAKKSAELPKKGRSLVVIARVGDHVRIRIFDAEGKAIVDKYDAQLPRGRDLASLRERLPRLFDDDAVSPEEKRKIVETAVSAAGLTRARAYDALFRTIKHGGKGNWTEVSHGVPMPPFSARLSDDEVERLVSWVLDR